jgi:hypothetical protein
VSTRGALSAVEGAQGLAVSTIDSSPAWVERWGQAASTPSARPAVVAGQGQVVSTIDSSPALLEGWGAGDKHTECQAGCGGLSGAGGTIGPSLALVPDWEQIVWLLVLPMRALHRCTSDVWRSDTLNLRADIARAVHSLEPVNWRPAAQTGYRNTAKVSNTIPRVLG